MGHLSLFNVKGYPLTAVNSILIFLWECNLDGHQNDTSGGAPKPTEVIGLAIPHLCSIECRS